MKKKSKKKSNSIKIIILVILTILLAGLYYSYDKYIKVNINLKEDIKVEINTSNKVKDFVIDITNGKLINGSDIITNDTLGSKNVDIKIKDRLKREINKKINIDVVDTTPPEIECKDKLSTTKGKKIDLLEGVVVKDNSLEEIKASVIGEYDIDKVGTYKLQYKAVDSSNNETLKDFELVVKKNTTTVASNTSYYIKVNKTHNVVMVYGKDDNNEYTKLIKTFVASLGENTPLGEFKTDYKAETLALEKGVYGHYTVRFLKSRGMWFHSVPYFSKPSVDENGDKHWDNLEYEEYNKLGTLASLGCIRLAVRDAKWIYQNISNGTVVEIYEDDNLPEGVVKPTPITIDVDSPNRGWDPTDTDPLNPWNN